MEDIRDIVEEKAVEKLKKSAFAKEHPDNLSCTFRKCQHGYFHIFLLLL